ncbi:hypothetical protein RhiirC2_850816 [Rhizophagus irregularis]|uniref:Uncharacterized protein n=1 Tax=Rhizophagus irregularis TaxID=588596 RepID=A0A2N1N611_9GLOM|nr:hypothetical protein RhiirC2_850816 [Rhizophagus irregularis]
MFCQILIALVKFIIRRDFCINCIFNIFDNKGCKRCQINYLKENFTNWTSGNEKIDNFIRKEQIKINSKSDDIVFEWIPYDQFNDIKEINEDSFFGIYSAIWKYGPLRWDGSNNKYSRKLDKEIILIYLHNLKSINEFLNEVKTFKYEFELYGISQNPSTKDLLFKWCRKCQTNYLKENFTNWSSGNEKIDNFIQKRQSEINDPYETVLEWIPYNQFHNINLFTANWKDGPLYWDRYIRKYNKKSNEVVHLKYLYNFHDIDEILNEVETHSPNFKIYGISQNPDTMVYIIIFRDKDYCIGCKKIYSIAQNKWCEKCLTNDLGKIFDNFIQLEKMGIMNDENSF